MFCWEAVKRRLLSIHQCVWELQFDGFTSLMLSPVTGQLRTCESARRVASSSRALLSCCTRQDKSRFTSLCLSVETGVPVQRVDFAFEAFAWGGGDGDADLSITASANLLTVMTITIAQAIEPIIATITAIS